MSKQKEYTACTLYIQYYIKRNIVIFLKLLTKCSMYIINDKDNAVYFWHCKGFVPLQFVALVLVDSAHRNKMLKYSVLLQLFRLCGRL